jgi:hypothetical protein
MKPATRSRFDYSDLDRLLKEDSLPEDVGNQLDEALNDLVQHAGETGYSENLPNRYYLLRELRNIFWKLKVKE